MDYGPFVLSVIVIVAIAVLVMVRRNGSSEATKKRHNRRYSGPTTVGRHDFAQQWQRIEGVMAQPGLESTRSAIFEADKLLDAALRQSGFRGDTMGERLKNARGHFNNNVVYQGLWEAHKMRNALAHELGFDLTKSVAQDQLEKFKAGLMYLKAF